MKAPSLGNQFTGALEKLIRTRHLNELLEFYQGEMRILVMIHLLPQKPITPSSISELTGMTRARIAAALGVLEKKGYIKRAADTNDRRRVLVELTENGKRYTEEKLCEIQTLFNRFIEELGMDDTAKLIELIEKTSVILTQIP